MIRQAESNLAMVFTVKLFQYSVAKLGDFTKMSGLRGLSFGSFAVVKFLNALAQAESKVAGLPQAFRRSRLSSNKLPC